MRSEHVRTASVWDWRVAADALVGPVDWTIHRLLPGYPATDATTCIDAQEIATTTASKVFELLVTNLLPDRTVRVFLTHPPAIDLPPERTGRAVDTTTYDPEFTADLACARGGNDPGDPTGSDHVVAAETQPTLDSTGPRSLLDPIRNLVDEDRPSSLRLRFTCEGPDTGGSVRSILRTALGSTFPDRNAGFALGCRAATITRAGDTPDAIRTLERVLAQVDPDARPTPVDPTSPISTHPVDDPQGLPTLDLGSAAAWHHHGLDGTTSTRETISTSVADMLDAVKGLPLGAPIDHGGRPAPDGFAIPVTGRTTVARYTIHHRDHEAFQSDYLACQRQSGPTIVLDGSGACSDAIAATYRAAGDGNLTPIMGRAPASLTDREYRSLFTHHKDTFLIDPTLCADPKAVGSRLLTALNDVASSLPNHDLAVVIDAPLACTTYDPLERLLRADHDVPTVVRIPVPHQQSVFGPAHVDRIRRAWYRLIGRHTTATLLTRFPTTTTDEAVAALTPPTADPEVIRKETTRLGPDHWVAHVKPSAFEEFDGDEALDPPESAATFTVHAPTPPPGRGALSDYQYRSLTERLSRYRQRGIKPDVKNPAKIDIEQLGAAIATRDTGEAHDESDFVPASGDTEVREDIDEGGSSPGARVPKTTLPYTKRFPDPIHYDPETHIVACGRCGNRYGPTIEGLERAIECCYDLAKVDRDDVPTVDAHLKLTASERRSLAYSDGQLVFLKLVNDAMLRRFDADLEYDIARDSMTLLRDYAGVDRDAVQQLVTEGLLRDEGRYPHQLYTITHQGRDLIKEGRRHGVDVGDGLGDLSESSEHVMLVELLRRYIDQEYVQDPACAATEVRSYYELGDHRFDVVALDDDGEVVIAGEGERPTNDVHEAVPADYDKMAAQGPEEAIWVVPSHDDGHSAVLNPLTNPADDDPRIDASYKSSTRMQKVTVDEPGLTQLKTITMIEKELEMNS